MVLGVGITKLTIQNRYHKFGDQQVDFYKKKSRSIGLENTLMKIRSSTLPLPQVVKS